jgi:hypothetical protein
VTTVRLLRMTPDPGPPAAQRDRAGAAA